MSTSWFKWEELMPEEMAKDFAWASPASLDKLGWIVAKQAVVLDQFPTELGTDRLSLGRPILLGLSTNVKAIVRLARQGLGGEIYPILRALIERVVTFYYLQACDEQELENYLDYSKQKFVRKMHRKITVNDRTFEIRMAGTFDVSAHPELERALGKFTSSKHKREITRWSPKSILEKLEIIDHAKTVDVGTMMVCVESFYDDASEVLHGTLYGCLFFFGAYQPGEKLEGPEDMTRVFRGNVCMIFFLVAILLAQLNKYVAGKTSRSDLGDTAEVGRMQALDLERRWREEAGAS